jgi:hypothetical protein
MSMNYFSKICSRKEFMDFYSSRKDFSYFCYYGGQKREEILLLGVNYAVYGLL